MDKFITHNSGQTKKLGENFSKSLKPGQVVFLYGELGAGKTTFIQGVSQGLGIKERIISPTFVLQRTHKTGIGNIKRINHIDLYRIEDRLEIRNLGLDEVFEENDSATFVEWADRIEDIAEIEGHKIYFKDIGNGKREIVIEKKQFSQLQKAIKVLRDGGIVIYPTDTAFGIGCRIDRPESIKKLFQLRRRPENKAVPVLFDSIQRVEEYTKPFDEKVKKLMQKHWPGAITIILPSEKSKISSLIRGGSENIGVRIPDHEIPLNLIKALGVPIVGTSANFSGEATPFSFEELDKRLIKLVDFTLEGKTKGKNLASTVVDCSVFPWKIVRQGSIVI